MAITVARQSDRRSILVASFPHRPLQVAASQPGVRAHTSPVFDPFHMLKGSALPYPTSTFATTGTGASLTRMIPVGPSYSRLFARCVALAYSVLLAVTASHAADKVKPPPA